MSAAQSIFAQFKRNRDERPEYAAFLIASGDRSVPITWREFAHDIEVIARIVQRHAPGSTIGILGENSYEWITAHAAGLFAGVRVVALETGLTAADIAERLAFTEAKVLVHSSLYADKAHEVESLTPGLIVAGFGSHKADEYIAAASAELEMGEPGIFDLPPRDESETAMIVFTSGTTSRPRGAELTLASLASFVEFSSRRLEMVPGDRSLMLLPLSHIYGIAVTYLMLANGVALGVCPDFRRFYDVVVRFRANCLYLVPALVEIFAAKVERRARSVEAALGYKFKWVLSGGAPLPTRVYDQLEALGAKVLQIYGLTETCALFAMSPKDDPRSPSVGLSCHGVAGMETRVGANGELYVRGPAVMKGYYKEPARTAEVLDADGWFNTGDVGRIDDGAYVWLDGRNSRTIVLSSGKKVAPEELEDMILSVPGIREVVVSGDGATRELKAEVYAAVSEESVRRQISALNHRLPVHKRIRIVEVRSEPFQRTASGKIKVERRQQVEAKVQVTRQEPVPAATVPAGISKPVSGPPRDAASFWKAYAMPLLIMAVVVVTVDVITFMLRNAGVGLPESVMIFEEIGEVVLAILVLLAVLGVRHRRLKALSEKNEKER